MAQDWRRIGVGAEDYWRTGEGREDGWRKIGEEVGQQWRRSGEGLEKDASIHVR